MLGLCVVQCIVLSIEYCGTKPKKGKKNYTTLYDTVRIHKTLRKKMLEHGQKSKRKTVKQQKEKFTHHTTLKNNKIEIKIPKRITITVTTITKVIRI